uniref:Uncharacterized protein n=1 Tax=Plectus sambesii TaxID=2011161 RepID=A0A914VFJ9_9BILA
MEQSSYQHTNNLGRQVNPLAATEVISPPMASELPLELKPALVSTFVNT